jgi:hypothetical protein
MNPTEGGRGELFDRLARISAEQLVNTRHLMDLFVTLRDKAGPAGTTSDDVEKLWRAWRAQLDEQIGRFEASSGATP